MQPEQSKTALYKRLIDGCLLNNRQAQKELYDVMSPKMFAVCMRYCSNRELAQDVLQEGFVKVFMNLMKYRGDGSFEGWVRKIFVNTAVEHFRKESRMFSVSDSESVMESLSNHHEIDELEMEDMIKMIQKLSTGYRTIFNLYVIEGYSHKEIAEMLNISEGTSKSQLARARYILQKHILESQQVAKTNVAL